MSHIVSIKTEVRDIAAIRAACSRLQLPEPMFGDAKLFNATTTGWRVQLPDWRYPVVANIETGELAFDNFSGRWGEQAKLDEFLKLYAVEKCRLEARKAGHTVFEQPLKDGSVKLTINVGSEA